MKLSRLLEGIEYEGNADIEIKDIQCDSRLVKEGSAFVCIKGYETDGHIYVKNCEKQGASAIIVQDDIDVSCPVIKVKNTRKTLAVICSRFYNNPSESFKLIGITGTNGKTTATYLIKTILEARGEKIGLIGTNQNLIGDRVIETTRTTPDAFVLNKIFREMADEGCSTVIMEVSSHALYLDRVYNCDFDVGIFTNLTQDHLDFHKTMENYAEAKSKLFSMCKIGVVNGDDPWVDTITKDATCEIITYGIDKKCDIKAQNVEFFSDKVKFNATGTDFSLSIPGRFSVYNALSAIGACKAIGIENEIIKEGLLKAKGVRGRAQVVDLGYDFTVMIDYAHTPDGIENILKTVRGFAKGRVIILFGCGGDRDNKKRPVMGKIASELADFCIITSDNPRTEDPGEIIKEILVGVNGEHTVIEDRRKAIEYAIKNAKKDDVVILAGKGHETYQTIGKTNIHFDEEEILYQIRDEINSDSQGGNYGKNDNKRGC